MEEKLSIIRPGTKVMIGGLESQIEAYVTNVVIYKKNAIAYYVAYWSGQERKEVRLEEFEVLMIDEDKAETAIGFK